MRVKLGDIASIKHGFAFSGESICEEDNGIVLVTPGNFSIGGGFQEEKCKFYTGKIPRDYVLSPGDLIVTMTDLSKGIDTLGYGALVPFTGRIYLHNQRIGLVEIKDSSVDKGYLARVLQTREYQKTIAGTSSGSTVHHTSPSKIESYSFELPDLKTQRRIAGVLSAYDELIENNRKQIKLLEEAARRLYKEWFVDLKFPDHEITPVIDGLPEGWRRMPLSSLADYMNGFAFKPTDHFRDGYPIIKIKELQEGVMADTPRNSGTVVPAKYFVRTGDLIFSWSATLVAKLWPGEPGLLNQHLFKVNPANGIPKSYLVEAINASIPELVGFTTGSTMTHLQRNKLDRYLLAVPNEPILCKFDCICTPVHNAALNLDRQITAAREARDRLLPKLMSGEIEV